MTSNEHTVSNMQAQLREQDWPTRNISPAIRETCSDIATSADIEAKATQRGLSLVGKGHGRIVFAGDCIPSGTVIKIARSTRGRKSNARAYNTYAQFPDEPKPLLVKPHAIGEQNRWLLLERVEKYLTTTESDIKNLLNEYDIDYNSLEIKRSNIGTYNGIPCLLDYGDTFTL